MATEAPAAPLPGHPTEPIDRDRLYVGGEWAKPAGSGTIDVIDSTTEQVIGRVPDATPADVDRAVAAARAAGEGTQTLTLGFVVPADHEPMRPTLALFCERHPEVELQVRFGEVTDPTGGVRDGVADAAVVVGAFDRTGLETLPLWTDPRGVAVGANHPLARKPEITIAELIAEPTFDFPVPDPVFRDYWMATNHRGGRPPKIAAQFRSLDGLLEAVRGGLGVNLIRERIVDTLGPQSGVVFRPVRGLEPAEVSLAWAEGNTSELVVGLIDAAKYIAD